MRVTLFEPNGTLSVELVCDALSIVGASFSGDGHKLTRLELLLAYDWAIRVHLRAGDNTTVRLRPRPSFVEETP